MSHTITADFSGGANPAIDKPAWQYDYGTDLVIKGLDLPTAVEVHFATAEYGGTAETRVGTTADGITTVAIPDRLLEMPGRQDYRIYAYIYLTDVDSGHTEYKICIRVRARPKPGETRPDEDKDHLLSDVLQAVNKLDKEKVNTPVSPVAGQLLRVKTINDDGTIVLETVEAAGGGGEISDVQINGTSVVDEGIANIPVASRTAYGAVKLAGQGVTINGGSLYTEYAGKPMIDSRNYYYQPITPAYLDYAVKAALCDGKGDEWTEAEQAAARERLNCYGKDVADDSKENLGNIISPNLFNPAEAKENTAINQGDGTELSFDNWMATGYIPASKNSVLYFSSNGEPTPYSTGAFYDSKKKFISGFGNPNNDNNITVTSDGYARFSFNSKKEKLQIEKGGRSTYCPFGALLLSLDVNENREEISSVSEEMKRIQTETKKIQEDHTNLFNKDTVTKGAVLPDSGYFDSSFTSWDTSDYIPVKPGMALYFSSNELPIGVASTGAYYDKEKKYLSPLKDEPFSITIPDNAYYIRFSKNGDLGDTLNTLKIEQYGITKFTPYGEVYVTVNESALPSSILPKWKGLKMLTLGDSITAMGGANGWTYWIKQYLLADKVVNVSVAGSTWQDKVANQTYDGNPQTSTDGNVMGNQVQKVLNAKSNGDADYQDFDVITFSFGTNDTVDFSTQTKESVENQFITNYAQNNYAVVPLESVNRQTLAGAMRYGFQKLHEAYPNAVIFMCTPTQECYESFESIYQKGDLINYIADRCGAETIDTRRCGIRNVYESQTTIDYDHPEQSGSAPIQTDLMDGIHTNENGAKKIAKYNAREIMKYLMIN